MDIFNTLPDYSRVWIYASTGKLSPEQSSDVQNLLDGFAKGWTSHQQQLNAKAALVKSHFLVFMVDESAAEISGCGIDKSVQLVKEIEQKTGISFFNRLNIHLEIENEVHIFNKQQLERAVEEGLVNENTHFFDNLVQTKADFIENWLKPVNKSWIWSKIKTLSA
ncbi:MAG: ABC transporter ATPase [Bacteroidia bacterium]